MKCFYIRNKRGITLIELIVVITLIAVIMFPISTFLISNYKIFNKTEKQIDAQRNAQNTMNLLITRAMEAKSVNIKSTSPNIDFEFDLGASKKWIFRYDTAAKALLANDDSGNTDYAQTRVYAENISVLNVEETSDHKTVKFTIQSKLGSEEFSITNEVSFRNK